MNLLFDEKTRIAYESSPVSFDMSVRDTALRVSSEVLRYVNSLGSAEVSRLMRKTRFFENAYLPDWIKRPEYFAPKPGRENVFAARLDFALHNNVPRLIELNTACPAGHVFYPSVCESVGAAPGRDPAVFSAYPKDFFSGLLVGRARLRSASPHIALLTSSVSRISNELAALRRQIAAEGVRCSVCNIQELTYRGGVPRYAGAAIDLVWCKFNDKYSSPLYGLVDENPEYLKRLLDAHLAGATDVVNPPLAFYFFEDKAFLGALRGELPREYSEFVAETGVVGSSGKRLSAGLTGGRASLVLKPRIGTRADGVLLGRDCSPGAWKKFLMEKARGGSYVFQAACNNKRRGGGGELRVLSVPVYAGKPAAVTGRVGDSFPVSIGKGSRIFAFSAEVPPLRNENEVLAGFNGKYFPGKLFPGYGARRAGFHKDILRVLDIAAVSTSFRKVAGRIKYFNARPDVYVENGRPWLLELNIDPGVGPQSHIAYLQQLHGLRYRNASGQNVIPFVESLSRLVRDLDGPLAILGSKSGAEIFDEADMWLVSKLKQACAAEIKFYPAAEWASLKRLKEPYFIRWLSMCQIRRDRGLAAAYARLLRGSEDLAPGKYSDIAVSKILLAELWDAADSGRLSAADAAVVRRTVPWSAVLRRGAYRYRGKALSLAGIFSRKDEFVVKKMHSYQAKDVYIGKDLSEREWRAALEAALRAGDYIVQRHVGNDMEMNVRLGSVRGERKTKKLLYMISPFIMGRALAGTFVRAWSATDPAITFEKKIIGTTEDFVC